MDEYLFGQLYRPSTPRSGPYRISDLGSGSPMKCIGIVLHLIGACTLPNIYMDVQNETD